MAEKLLSKESTVRPAAGDPEAAVEGAVEGFDEGAVDDEGVVVHPETTIAAAATATRRVAGVLIWIPS